MMADKEVWLSIQPFLSEEDTTPLTGPNRAAALQVFAASDNAYTLARKYKIKTAFGSDMLFAPAWAKRQGTMLTHLTRWYSNSEILSMATSVNAQLLGLSGPRNPYPGKLRMLGRRRRDGRRRHTSLLTSGSSRPRLGSATRLGRMG